jgi:hypothetical protein
VQCPDGKYFGSIRAPGLVYDQVLEFLKRNHERKLREVMDAEIDIFHPPGKTTVTLVVAASPTALRVTTTERRSFTAYLLGAQQTLCEAPVYAVDQTRGAFAPADPGQDTEQ